MDTNNIKAYLPKITLRPRQNGRHFADDICKCIFLNENFLISNIISLKFVSEGPIKIQLWLFYWRIYASLGLNEIGTLTIKTYRQTAVNQSVVGRVNQQDFFFLVNVLYLYTTWPSKLHFYQNTRLWWLNAKDVSPLLKTLKLHTVETLYNTINFCSSTHKRHSIARPKGRGMGCLLWIQRATYRVDLSKLSSLKYLL